MLAAGLIIVVPQNTIGWRLADACFFLMVILLLAVVHLLVQTGVGALLGLHPGSAVIGYGATLWHMELGTLKLDLKTIPVGSALMLIGTSERYYRIRQFFAMLAGPICTLALLVLFIKLFGYKSQREVDALIGLNWDAFIPRAALVLLLLNLWPRKIRLMNYAQVMTDGMRLARLPFLSSESVVDEVNTAYMEISFACLTQGRESESLALTQEGLRKMPDNFWLQYRLLGIYGDCGDFDQHRIIGEKLLKRSDVGPWGMAHVQCDMAYYAFFLQREEYLEEADAVSLAIYRAYPWYPYFIGTRGAVLAWQGRTAEGEYLLKQAIELHSSSVAKADLLCTLAAIEQGRGNTEGAIGYIERARRISPHNAFLQRLDEGSFASLGDEMNSVRK